MAKKKKKLTPGGPPKGKIIVNSATWGMHERFARGTHKPAPVNDAFKEASGTLHQANPYARLINSAIKPFTTNLKDGTLWSRLTQHFYPFVKSKTPVDYRSLVTRYQPEAHENRDYQPKDSTNPPPKGNVAINKNYRLNHTLIFKELKLTSDPDKKRLQIYINGLSFSFRNAVADIDAAHLTMIALYVDDRNEYVETRHQAAALELNETEVYFELPIPPNTGVVLLCMKCEAYHNGGLSGNMRTKGIDFVKSVALNDIAVVGEQVAGEEQVAEETEPVAQLERGAEVENAVIEQVTDVDPFIEPEKTEEVEQTVEADPVIEPEVIAEEEQVAEVDAVIEPLQVTEIEYDAKVGQDTHPEAEASSATASVSPPTAAPVNQAGNATKTTESKKDKKKKDKDKDKDIGPAKGSDENEVEEAAADSPNQLSLW